MSKKELQKLAIKIKDGKATKKEELVYWQNLNKILKELNSDLSKLISK